MPHLIPLSVLAAAVFCVAGVPVLAQDASLVDRLQTVSTAMDLTSVDQRAWHLKLDVTAFDDEGKNPLPGTIEVWQSAENRRTVSTFGDSVSSSLRSGSKTWRSSSGPGVPTRAVEVLRTVLSAGPSKRDIDESKPELRKESFGQLKVDCIMLTQPMNHIGDAPLGLFPTYCFLPGGSRLVASFDLGSVAAVFKSVGNFMDRQVPVKMELQRGDKVVAAVQVSKLATYVPEPGEFDPAPGMQPTGTAARISGGIMAGSIINRVQPVYPPAAKTAHITGSVLLRAVIGTDGHIHSLRPISAPEPSLALAAIVAVRQWTYKPYVLNGEPAEVDTTITVNFAMN